jgi:hydroxymethylpyrimidine pyrophosphatase-like HAD family hydrolase
MKQYKAIFFDWDGTAVLSRKAPVEDAVNAMRPLLEKGVKLAIISGTTYENIAGGKLESYFTPEQLQNLYLGLGRGAYDYGFDADGKPVLLANRVPDSKGILAIHDACYRIHRVLLEEYGMNTDIVFSRPNYCKIDMMPVNNRGENLFLQEGEAAKLQRILSSHGIESIETLIKMAESFGTEEMPLPATTDAKYLEVGPTGKSDNANALFERFGFDAEDCCFWGDEFIGVTDSIFGSDAGMLTEKTSKGDFFDVSNLEGARPQQVKQLGGGIMTFLNFLVEQQ